MGTPVFAVESLRKLHENNFNIVCVVTAPDKPAGRGQKLKFSEVKEYSLQNNLKILQPSNLKDESFINELKSLKPDLQIVVAFRMLPKIVWELPKYRTFNLHASLLPQYRGAAPINWALINGERKTGVTTFFIEEQIDTGNIIFQKEVDIQKNDNAGTLHDKLMYAGADLVVETVKAIKNNSYNLIPQMVISKNLSELKTAPKIFKEDCKINWNKSLAEINNFIRGLSPYPAAWTEIVDKENNTIISIKIFDCEVFYIDHNFDKMYIETDNKNFLKIFLPEGYISILSIQVSGKKLLKIKDFLIGYSFINKEFLSF
jgi:methionyl-tRNA formyltransferase